MQQVVQPAARTVQLLHLAISLRMKAKPLQAGLETEIPKLQALLRRYRDKGQAPNEDHLETITDLLSGDGPVSVQALQASRQELALDLWRVSKGPTARLVKLSGGGAPLTCTLLGAAATVLLAIIVFAIWFLIVDNDWLGDRADGLVFMPLVDVAPLCGAALAGATASVAVRMNQFDRPVEYHPLHVAFNGCFKPLLAVIFAVIVYSVLKSDIVRIAGISETMSNPSRYRYLIWVIGFLCGFSERFAIDLIGRAERAIAPAAAANANPPSQQKPQALP